MQAVGDGDLIIIKMFGPFSQRVKSLFSYLGTNKVPLNVKRHRFLIWADSLLNAPTPLISFSAFLSLIPVGRLGLIGQKKHLVQNSNEACILSWH